jgi:mono/diheme cytochrome c family protein
MYTTNRKPTFFWVLCAFTGFAVILAYVLNNVKRVNVDTREPLRTEARVEVLKAQNELADKMGMNDGKKFAELTALAVTQLKANKPSPSTMAVPSAVAAPAAPTTPQPAAAAAAPPAVITTSGISLQDAIKAGSAAYALCAACHQPTGMGIPTMFPPLAGSDWVTGGTERLIRVTQHGLTGEVLVNGQKYNFAGGMLPIGATMSSQDLANVLTYIRNSFGNKASQVTKEMVEKVRKDTAGRTTQWTAAELESFAKTDVNP